MLCETLSLIFFVQIHSIGNYLSICAEVLNTRSKQQ